ncbi:TetR/AcrR family transcriptional regulator [Thermoleophilum album]|uniref:TetR/AcrR family transcriptional regulator n=1 Tax=Thermoleophilum album TaxID=29539 RepID=UPI00237C8596|nr:TetR/AcrR family transcriptional regulator [Thermoleophilum album]WDT94259.1 TetR/AcrR family transcriptional regulator [Thermoleophilum album]
MSGDERRESLLDAALQVFAERGYEGASIGAIARRAGVSKSLIYEHFPSKLELHLAVLQRHGRELEERLERALAGEKNPERGTRVAIRTFLDFVAERRDSWRILVAEVHEPRARAELERIVERVTTLVARRIAASYGGDSERPTPGDEVIARLFVGGMEALGKWSTRRPDLDRERLAAVAFALYWEGAARLMERARATLASGAGRARPTEMAERGSSSSAHEPTDSAEKGS